MSGCRTLEAPGPGAPTAPTTRAHTAARRLEVYVASHSLSCAEALRLAAAVSERFPQLEVRTVDVDAVPAGAAGALPDRVVPVPMYLLDGDVVALGYPEPERLFARIASSLPAERGEGPHGK